MDPYECLPDEQKEGELSVDFLQRFEEEVKESGDRVLLLLDDVVNDIRKNKGVDKMLAKILYNRRHITADDADDPNGVTVWLTVRSGRIRWFRSVRDDRPPTMICGSTSPRR